MQGHIRERSKGTWAVILDVGKDNQGNRQRKWHTVKGTKRDAQRELTRLLHDLNAGSYVETSRVTVAAFMEQWLTDYARPNLAAKTTERYDGIIRHVVRELGHFHLDKLKPLELQGYYSRALVGGRTDGKAGGLAAKTLLQHHRIIRQALQHAVQWGLIGRNIADAVEPPRPQRKEMHAFDEGQTSRLLEAVQGTWLYLPILLAVSTGLRRGELLALRWQDVDLKEGRLVVRQSLEQTKGGLSFKQPKTAKSRRAVALPSLVVDALVRHRAEQGNEDAGYEDRGLVITRSNGSPVIPLTLTHAFAKVARRLELPSTRLHDLRHAHATALFQAGIHPKIVSERLGHATTSITMDVYSHLLPGMQEEAALRMDEALRRGLNG